MNDTNGGDSHLHAVIADYMRRVDSGENIDQQAFIARHPNVAEALRSYFETANIVDLMAGPVQPAGDQLPLASRETVGPSANSDSVPARATRDLEIGDVPEMIGRYRIVRILGQGGMGWVYLAEDTQLRRQVALKIPKFTDADGPEVIERFSREARAAATLNHRNICAVYDIGELDGMRYITMAYVDGRSLSDFVNPERPQPQRQVAIILRTLARALQAAHERGVIHRDLKPSNIIVDQDQEPVVMDFGLARQIDRQEDERLTQSGTIIGSPAYMPPEQVEGDLKRIGPASDIYSLGVILYELLTGQLPFQGSIAAVIGQIVSREPKPPSRIRFDLDPRLNAICLKMMSKRIERRYASMQDVADALAEYLKSPAQITTIVPQSGGSQDESSTGQREITADERDSLIRTARQCVRVHDYEQALQLLQEIPDELQTDETQRLIEKAQGLKDEIDFLVASIDEAILRKQYDDVRPNVERLLELKPGHAKARRIQEKLDQRRRARRNPPRQPLRIKLGSVGPIAMPMWMVWTAASLLGAIAVFGVMTLYLRLGDETVKIEIDDSLLADKDVIVSFDGEGGIKIENIDETILLKPGKHTWELHRGDEVIKGPVQFTITDGDNDTLRISLENVVVNLEPPPHAVAPFEEQQAKRHQQAWAEYLGAPVEFTSDTGMKFQLIPPGEFVMGSSQAVIDDAVANAIKLKLTEDPVDLLKSEGPSHAVHITRPYFFGRYGVTVSQFRQFVTATGYTTESERSEKGGRGFDAQRQTFTTSPQWRWDDIGAPFGERLSEAHPVVNVTWNDAVAFCAWLGEQDGATYRLPSEAEWEYGCRAGTVTRWHTGDDLKSLEGFANVMDESLPEAVPRLLAVYKQFVSYPWNDGFPGFSPVGQFESNPFGLYDMHGNVWEWCGDWFDPKYYSNSAKEDPHGPDSGTHRAKRGGMRIAQNETVTSARRGLHRPSHADFDLGFRVVREIEPSVKAPTHDSLASVDRSASTPRSEIAAGRTDLKGQDGELEASWEWTELLGPVDLSRDRIVGNWTKAADGLRVQPQRFGRIAVPVIPTGDYELAVELTRDSGQNEVNIMFPVGPTSCMLSLGRHGNWCGLQHVNHAEHGKPYPGRFVNGTRHRVELRVAVDNSIADLHVKIDGRELFDWSGPVASLTPREVWRIHGDSIGLGAHYDAVVFHSVRVRGPAGSLRSVSRLRKSGRIDAKDPIDALRLVRLEDHRITGTWRREGRALTTTAGEYSRVAIPIVPEGGYRLRFTFKQTTRNQEVAAILPVGQTGCLLYLFRNGRECGLERISGTNVVTNREISLTPGKLYAVDVVVKVDSNNAQLSVNINSQNILSWNGPLSAISIREDWRLHPPSLGLGSHGGSVIFQTASFQDATGSSFLLQ